MAVPASGSLSLRGIRREIGTNNYSSSTNYTNISLEDMSEGVNGTINTGSSSRPDGTNPHRMSEFRGYDHDAASNITMTLYLDNYLSPFNTPNYLEVYVDGTRYYVDDGNQTSYSVSVPPNTYVNFQASSQYVNSFIAHNLEIYDEFSLYEYDYGTFPSLSFNYTTPASNFNMYASAY